MHLEGHKDRRGFSTCGRSVTAKSGSLLAEAGLAPVTRRSSSSRLTVEELGRVVRRYPGDV
jgi:hypothetical protein